MQVKKGTLNLFSKSDDRADIDWAVAWTHSD